MSLFESVRRQGARAASCVRLAFRALLSVVDTRPGVQLGQCGGLAGENLQAHEVFQHYGFTSAPPAGTQCIVLPLGGKTAHGVIVATEHAAYRIQGLESGEVALYTQDDKESHGHRIVFRRGGLIEVQAKNINVRAESVLHLSAEEVEVHGDKRFEWDVNGYGEAVNSGPGGYTVDSYKQGATPLTTTEHGIKPPEVD